ncbi:hypothetical protein PIB30_012386 [Stylosanthes scabra]|uniref:RING-type domain-containing protein n=1 Tax=Stylosanthes scabra TaxID=79078 RepID=A0ABU6Q624_9FABA|nr:hypothetical protein [Stylosanthes scabra]
MPHTTYSLEITPNENPAVPPELSFGDSYSINLSCTVEFIRVSVGISYTIELNEAFLVPSDVLRNCTPLTDINGENMELPISYDLLDEILAQLAESAGDSSEMDVNLHVFMHFAEEDLDFYNSNGDCQYVSAARELVSLLERVKVDEEEEDGVDEQCAICLEELFGDGNEDSRGGEVVRTNCSHVFHERCILRWIERCIKSESPYSCPLCRCNNIFPTSEEDE